MIIESGNYAGVIARCDICNRTSGYLDFQDCYEWTEERRTATPTDGFGEWRLVWATPASERGADADHKAHVTCPDCRKAPR